MATKEQSTSVQVGAGGGNVALPQDVLASLAAAAKEEAAKERPAISKISLQAGVISYAGAPVTNNELEAVILTAGYRNVFYASRFDQNNIKNPNCFALSETDEDMAPHENVIEPEHATCAGCPRNEWGSDPNGGRGKACKQSRRLVLMPATAIDEGAEKVKTAELAVMDLPVTSVKNYSHMVNALSASAGVPTWAAVVKIGIVRDPKTQFKVVFAPMRVVPSVPVLDAIKARRAEAVRISLDPYDETSTKAEAEEEAARAAAAGKKSNKY